MPIERKERAQASSQAPASQTPRVAQAMRSLRRPTGQAEAVEVLRTAAEKPSTAAVERIDELINARRFSRLRIAGTLLSSAAILALVGWVVFFSELFALDVQRIEVAGGNEQFTNESAQNTFADLQGTPITRLSMSALRDKLLEQPYVKDAVITRKWPAGLAVDMTLRLPALVEQTGQGYQLLDNEAVALTNITEQPAGLPLVVLPSDEAQRAEAAADLALVWGILPEDLRKNIAQWNIHAHQISMTFTDGRVAKWGTSADSQLKARVLPLLISQRYAQVYDVSSPTAPVTSGS